MESDIALRVTRQSSSQTFTGYSAKLARPLSMASNARTVLKGKRTGETRTCTTPMRWTMKIASLSAETRVSRTVMSLLRTHICRRAREKASFVKIYMLVSFQLPNKWIDNHEIKNKTDTGGCKVFYATMHKLEEAVKGLGLPDVAYILIHAEDTQKSV